MISTAHKLSVRQQCEHLGLNRSYVQYEPRLNSDDTTLANLLAEIYRQYPVYGYRRITQQVWQTDITYVRTPHGFMYLNAFIDVCSRTVVGWSLSNTLNTASCLVALDRAIAAYGMPNIINTDQGCQYTSHEWIHTLKELGIRISMNGVGRSNDNAHIERLWRTIKYEGFVLFLYGTVVELKESIRQTIQWYNHQRPHSALDGQTPLQKLEQSLIKQEDSTKLMETIILTPEQGKALYL